MTFQMFFLCPPSDSFIAILVRDGVFLYKPVVGRVFKEISARSIKVMAKIKFL
jgi:hypothetical protein